MPSLAGLLQQACAHEAHELVVESGQPVVLTTTQGAQTLDGVLDETELFEALTQVLSPEQQVELAVGNLLEFRLDSDRGPWTLIAEPGVDGVVVRGRLQAAPVSQTGSGVALPPMAPFAPEPSDTTPAASEDFGRSTLREMPLVRGDAPPARSAPVPAGFGAPAGGGDKTLFAAGGPAPVEARAVETSSSATSSSSTEVRLDDLGFDEPSAPVAEVTPRGTVLGRAPGPAELGFAKAEAASAVPGAEPFPSIDIEPPDPDVDDDDELSFAGLDDDDSDSAAFGGGAPNLGETPRFDSGSFEQAAPNPAPTFETGASGQPAANLPQTGGDASDGFGGGAQAAPSEGGDFGPRGFDETFDQAASDAGVGFGADPLEDGFEDAPTGAFPLSPDETEGFDDDPPGARPFSPEETEAFDEPPDAVGVGAGRPSAVPDAASPSIAALAPFVEPGALCFVHAADVAEDLAEAFGVPFVVVDDRPEGTRVLKAAHQEHLEACTLIVRSEDPSKRLGWLLRRLEEGWRILIETRATTAEGARRILLGVDATPHAQVWLDAQVVRWILLSEDRWIIV